MNKCIQENGKGVKVWQGIEVASKILPSAKFCHQLNLAAKAKIGPG
jgi:hypothetical protein